jgi:hypothetical protein
LDCKDTNFFSITKKNWGDRFKGCTFASCYFCFILPEELVKQLPDRLVHQALAIAHKVDKMIAGRVGKKGLKKNK